MAAADLEVLVSDPEIVTAFPGKTHEISRDTGVAYEEARVIYGMGHPDLMFRLGWTAEEYAEWIANVQEIGDHRVRTVLRRLARHDWIAFEADVENPRLAIIDLVDHIDIRRAGDIWITSTHYLNSKKTVIARNKPRDIGECLAYMRQFDYTVHAYGATWYRIWPGKPSPVRTFEEIQRDRQKLDDGKLYVPEDYHVARGQIDLAYDL